MQKFAQYWKAAIAALAPVFLMVQSAVTDDTITQDEWVKIVAAIVAAAAVYVVPNARKTGTSE